VALGGVVIALLGIVLLAGGIFGVRSRPRLSQVGENSRPRPAGLGQPGMATPKQWRADRLLRFTVGMSMMIILGVVVIVVGVVVAVS
jgi:hypothetical protein